MEDWNKLLHRQIKKHFGDDPIPDDLAPLFKAISSSYDHFERDNTLIGRAMDLSSDELIEANRQLRKTNEELDRFVYSTSHDLRAPLTSIMGLLQIIDMQDDPESTKDCLRLIKRSTEKLDEFIREIVAYTQNKRQAVDPEKIDFERVIDSCIENLNFMPDSAEIKKMVRINGSDVFYSDIRRLQNLFSNLISNSIKYSNPESGSPYVSIGVTINQSQAEIVVEDNGIGIKEEHLPHIFEMFYRASTRSKGSGIGLYIVKEIVEKLSGRISVDSKYGVGTTFVVVLPSINSSDGTLAGELSQAMRSK